MNVNVESQSVGTNLKSKTAWLPIILCWFVYTSAYLGRYSYASNITLIMDAFGVNHADAGLVTTCFFFAYGVGQIINGILCKYYNKRLIIALSLLVSSVLNLLVFLGIPFAGIKYLWLLNGMFQSILWVTLVCTLSENLKTKDLATAVIVMSTPVAVGTFITYGLSALFTVFGGYKYSFLCGAVAMSVVAVIWIVFYGKAFRGEGSKEKASESSKIPNKTSSAVGGLIFMIVILGFFAVINNLVKDGLTTWVPAIFKEKFGMTDSLSVLLTLVMPLLGMFCSALNTVAERRIKSFISISGLWYLITAGCIVAVLMSIDTRFQIVTLLAFGLISLFMHGVNNVLTSMAPLYMRDKMNSGLVAGVLNGCCYIGSTISSYGLGHIADKFGWESVFILLLVMCCIPIVISLAISLFRQICKISKNTENYNEADSNL